MSDLVRLMICGGAGEGRSTLIGWLRSESKRLCAEPPAEAETDLRFATARREYIVAHTPDHARAAHAMLTEALSADVAIVLVDARKGVLAQTRRDSTLVSLLGVRHVLLAVNKMDLVDYAEARFESIQAGYLAFAQRQGFTAVTCIALSALEGDNVLAPSPKMPWYQGPTLLGCLDALALDENRTQRAPFSLPAPSVVGAADQFRVTLLWLDPAPLLPGRAYFLNVGATSVGAEVSHIRHKHNADSREELAARQLELNEIGVCNLATDRPITIDLRAQKRDSSGFILIDRLSGNPVGAGRVEFALRRADNIHPQLLAVDKAARTRQMGQKPCILWFTGLSGAGKSAIADQVEKTLHALGRHTYLLDGDNVRHGLNRDLGFTDAARVENIRRVAEVAKLMLDAGLIVLVAFISPFRSERRMARSLVAADEFIEIFVDTPLAVAESRDTKGLYRKARRGELPHFTGIDSAYEAPQRAQVRLDTTRMAVAQAAGLVIDHLRQVGILAPHAETEDS